MMLPALALGEASASCHISARIVGDIDEGCLLGHFPSGQGVWLIMGKWCLATQHSGVSIFSSLHSLLEQMQEP